MNNKFFGIIIVALIVGTGTVLIVGGSNQSSAPKERLGIAQSNEGQNHIPEGTQQDYKNTEPTSGPHSQNVPWGTYKQEIPNENVIHNMEHGGIVISYSPDLDGQIVTKIEQLFTKPYSNPKFIPSKAVVMPGSKNDKPIVMRSWDRLMKLDAFNEQTMIDYYLKNVNKSPEPAAT